VENIGFELVFTSGFGISGSTLGRPDFGFLTATEMLYTAGRIAQAVSIPLIADTDTGYGNPLNVMRTVSDIVPLGVAGIILEDQLFANMVEGGKTPFLAAPELEKLGFKLVAYPLSGLFAATAAMTNCLIHLKEHGTSAGAPVNMLDLQQYEKLIDLEHFRKIEMKYVTKSYN